MRPEYRDIEAEFISRDPEIDLFLRTVKGELAKRILVFQGIGGIGKTWLLTRLGHECDEQKWLSATIDFTQGYDDYLAVVTEIANQLGRERFQSFNRITDDYLQKVWSTYVPSQQYQDAERERKGPDTRFTGSLASVVGAGIVGIRLLERIDSLLDTMQADVVGALVEDMSAISSGIPVALMFDTYEYAENSQLGQWIQDFLVSANREQGLYGVIAGRNQLRLMREWRQQFTQIELSCFSEQEVIGYLLDNRRLGFLAQDVTETIWQLTKGLPLCVGLAGDLLADRQKESADALQSIDILEQELNERLVSSFLMERILERVDSEIQSAIMYAAITRWFDGGILDEVSGLIDVQRVIDRLRKYSFTRIHPFRGYTFHDIIRELLLVKWYRDNYDEFLELNIRALKYFERQAASGLLENRGRFTLERLYHQLIVDEDKGIRLFEQQFKQAESLHQLDYCQALLAEVEKYPNLLETLEGYCKLLNP